MYLRFIDWIWQVRGNLALAPGQSSDDAFDKLDPLFQQTGTSHERTNNVLTFRKKDQAAQDKMSVFDGGVLRIEHDGAGSVLRYRLTSKALLFCFFAPLLFLGIAQLTIFTGKFQKASAHAAGKSDKKPTAIKDAVVPMNPIDKFLGAPAPESPGKKGAGKTDDDKKSSPTPAYVFAGFFAVLYIIGRLLEHRLVKILFRKKLLGL